MENETKKTKVDCNDDAIWREQILKKIRQLQVSFFLILCIMLFNECNSWLSSASLFARYDEMEKAIHSSSHTLTHLEDKVSLLGKEQELMKKMSAEEQDLLTIKLTKVIDEMKKTKSMMNERNMSIMQIEETDFKEYFNELKPIPKFVFDGKEDTQLIVKKNWHNRKLQEKYCDKKPILHPFNDITGNVYDQRVAGLLDVFQSVSSYTAIHDHETPQYKAACFILYDDIKQMPVENEFTVERYVLHLFLSSVNYLLNGEEFPENPCDLVSIIDCDKKGHVTKLTFDDLDLDGTIPSELHYLRYLKVLDLNYNHLSGTIPSTLGNMKKLKYVYLSENILEGPIPTSLFDALDLRYLYLQNNMLTGTIPPAIGRLEDLQRLYLNGNLFTGMIPTEVGTLNSLTDFMVFDNLLTGKLPDQIKNINSMELFYVDKNKLSGTLPNIFASLTHLAEVYAFDNLFSGELPESLWNVDSLSALVLHHNNLHGNVPETYCSNRTILDLDTSNWFTNAPKVNCTCCQHDSCSLWDPIWDITSVNVVCPAQNVMDLYIDYGIQPTEVLDVHASEIIEAVEGICYSQTGCYKVKGVDLNDQQNTFFQSHWYFGYSSEHKAVIPSDPDNPICDPVTICGNVIDSNHPRRSVLNYFMQTLISDSSILYDTESYHHKALCWMISSEDESQIDHLNLCDGTLLQYAVMILFFFSTNYFEDNNMVSSKVHLCDYAEIKCDGSFNFIEEINLQNKGLEGSLISEIGFLQSLKRIDLSFNKFTGTIHKSILTGKSWESFNVSNNSFEGDSETIQYLLSNFLLKKLDISNNLFVGTLPSTMTYPFPLESIDVANNLLQGPIPDSLFECLRLHTIDLSQNNFDETIPSSLGLLSNLQNIYLNENEISGSIPTQVFNLTQMKVLMVYANKLTGSIPTFVGNLKNLSTLVMNHNRLKGNIPVEFQVLEKITTLHLHHNQLTGSAPALNSSKISYITDCGFPSFALPSHLKCESCTMCCNSYGDCQRVKMKSTIWLYISLSVVSICLVVMAYKYLTTSDSHRHDIPQNVEMSEIYTKTSVHSFIFAKGIVPKFIYSLSICIQFALFSIYLISSDISKEGSDWQFTYQCPDNSIECINLKKVNGYGWMMFSIVILCFTGPDIVMSVRQIRQGLLRVDMNFMTSGVVLFMLTVTAVSSSYMYNRALAGKNTDLIMNAVILIFIMELDDQIYIICQKLFPKWTKDIDISIDTTVSTRNFTMELSDLEFSPRTSSYDIGKA